MPAANPVVLGLVLALPAAGPLRASALAAIAARSDLRPGEPRGHLLPLTAETDDPLALHRWLEALPGILAVDVAFVEVDQPATPSPSSESHAT
jgi:hypothetical protein